MVPGIPPSWRARVTTTGRSRAQSRNAGGDHDHAEPRPEVDVQVVGLLQVGARSVPTRPQIDQHDAVDADERRDEHPDVEGAGLVAAPRGSRRAAGVRGAVAGVVTGVSLSVGSTRTRC